MLANVPLIPKFASEVTGMVANFGIGTLDRCDREPVQPVNHGFGERAAHERDERRRRRRPGAALLPPSNPSDG